MSRKNNKEDLKFMHSLKYADLFRNYASILNKVGYIKTVEQIWQDWKNGKLTHQQVCFMLDEICCRANNKT